MLLVAVTISLFLGDYMDAVIVGAVVLMSTLLGFWQELRAANALAALLAVIQAKATVLRDGQEVDAPFDQVIVGDVIVLNAGGTIPGDGILLEAKDLFVDESALKLFSLLKQKQRKTEGKCRQQYLARISMLGWTVEILLLAVGCQSTMPTTTNLDLVTYSVTHFNGGQLLAEPPDTICVAPPSTHAKEAIINSSLELPLSSVLTGHTEYTQPTSVRSEQAIEEAQWQFGALLDSRNPDTSLYGQDLLPRTSTILERLWDDQKNFYSPESVTLLAGGLVVGGLMANTSIDEDIHRHFQSSIRGATSDEWFESLHASKELGNGLYTLPVFATAWATGELFPDNKLVEMSGQWGERSIRGFVVGAPPLIIMQKLTGGSRPTETDENSEWQPFQDNNGISGHAFMGSLPFITAAKMTDSQGYKFLFYAGSTIAPLSRVNDNAHYPSQVALGWWMAYLAASAIDATDNPNARWQFYPYSTGDGSGMMAELRY
jgi:E1-E2 ATPase